MDRRDITGLVLAGGRGSRMGGIDKGLALHHGIPLARHALQRLAPQVGTTMISANRHVEAYAAMAAPVVSDEGIERYDGPLAGMLAGLRCCTTDWLVSVPCDTPDFPADLVDRLAEAVTAESAELAIAATREDRLRLQPVFCLMHRDLASSLSAFLARGERRIEAWSATHRRAIATFDDAAAFFNANTADELAQLQPR